MIYFLLPGTAAKCDDGDAHSAKCSSCWLEVTTLGGGANKYQHTCLNHFFLSYALHLT